MKKHNRAAVAAACIAAWAAGPSAATDDADTTTTPIRPVISTVAEENFQAFIIEEGMRQLGYAVEETKIAQVQLAILSVCKGDADYYPSFWAPLQDTFWSKGGGEDNCTRLGPVIRNSMQGYLIDKASAERLGIRTIDQLADPDIAREFDVDGNARADLYGCEPGWACEGVQRHHIEAYGLAETVELKQGGYFAIMPDAIARVRAGKPTLYYSWTPLWLNSVLKPGIDVVWLEVPYTTLPGRETRDEETTVEGIGNVGFPINHQYALANRTFADTRPRARRFLELVEIAIEDVNRENGRMADGENTVAAIREHATQWIADHGDEWTGWIEEASQEALSR